MALVRLDSVAQGSKVRLPRGKGTVYVVGDYGTDYRGVSGIKLHTTNGSGRYYCLPGDKLVEVVEEAAAEKATAKEAQEAVGEVVQVADKHGNVRDYIEVGSFEDFFKVAEPGQTFVIGVKKPMWYIYPNVYRVDTINSADKEIIVTVTYLNGGQEVKHIKDVDPDYRFLIPKEEHEKAQVKKEAVRKIVSGKTSLVDYLKSQDIDDRFIKTINAWRREHALSIKDPLYPRLRTPFIGGTQLKLALAALMAGHHIMLEGPKGSGKNTLAETCAFILGAPLSEVQGHRHMDSDGLVGHEVFKSHVRDVQDFVEMYDELKNQGLPSEVISAILAASGRKDEVTFLHGTVLIGARDGHFVVIDEANTIPPEALIVTHSLRDDRRRIEIPGYGVVQAHPRFRMILTLNYGYAGTSEMNQATADGFVPIHVPPMSESNMALLLMRKYHKHHLDEDKALLVAGLFKDILSKSGADGSAAQISDRAVSVRAIFQALDLVLMGISPQEAFLTCYVNRTPDEFEQNVLRDVICTRIRSDWTREDFFNDVDDDGIEEIE